MALKKILALALVLFSVGVHAIPPAPPAAIFKKIKTITANSNNCITENGIALADLLADSKEDEHVKFDLMLNQNSTEGIVTAIVDGEAEESIGVICN